MQEAIPVQIDVDLLDHGGLESDNQNRPAGCTRKFFSQTTICSHHSEESIFRDGASAQFLSSKISLNQLQIHVVCSSREAMRFRAARQGKPEHFKPCQSRVSECAHRSCPLFLRTPPNTEHKPVRKSPIIVCKSTEHWQIHSVVRMLHLCAILPVCKIPSTPSPCQLVKKYFTGKIPPTDRPTPEKTQHPRNAWGLSHHPSA